MNDQSRDDAGRFAGNLMNAAIRRAGPRPSERWNRLIHGEGHAPPQNRESEIERELAEARVALDVLNGKPEAAARIRHGLDRPSDWGGGARGPRWHPPEPSFNDVIRETIARKRGQSGA